GRAVARADDDRAQLGEHRPRLRRRAGLPVVVATVPVAERERARIDVVEAVDVDRREVAAELREVAAHERVRAAGRAEVALADAGAPLVHAEARFAGEHAQLVGLAVLADEPELLADRAVAAARAGGQIEVGV